MYNLYGPTEASIDVAAYACGKGGEEASVPIGRPIWNTQIYLLDDELNPAPVGIAGELYIGGVGLARGYLDRPGLTAERFLPDPFGVGGRLYRTGDLARWRADGAMEYLGRIDHQVKLRGFRIELGEIEAALPDIGCVRAKRSSRCVRIGLAASSSSPTLSRCRAKPIDPAALRQGLARSLPDYMVPSAFVELDALPLTSKWETRPQGLAGAAGGRRGGGLCARHAAARRNLLAGVWTEVWRSDGLGSTDNFFALGGDSILSIQVASRIRAAGFDLTPRHVFLHPTVAALAPAAATGRDASEHIRDAARRDFCACRVAARTDRNVDRANLPTSSISIL